MSRPGGLGDLTEWVAYLGDIGVKELRMPEPVKTKKQGAAKKKIVEKKPARSANTLKVSVTPPDERLASAGTLQEVRRVLGDCKRCKLHSGRRNIVFGVGDPAARLMFIGEGPGADEDASGEPFVGRSGKKLDEIIGSIGLKREDVFIANIVKCRPPGNRDPQPDEVDICSPFLFAQIDVISPRVIVTLGRPAAHTLLGVKTGIKKLRGNWHSFRGIPLMPTFHPSYLLRVYTQENRQLVWNDIRAARARMDEGS